MSAVGEDPPPAHRHVPLHPAQPLLQPQPGGGRVGARRARAAAPAGGGGRRGGGPVRGARAVRGVRARLQQLRPVSARAGGQRPGRLQLPGTPGPGQLQPGSSAALMALTPPARGRVAVPGAGPEQLHPLLRALRAAAPDVDTAGADLPRGAAL